MRKNLIILFFSAGILNGDCIAQGGIWTWINGDSTFNSPGNFGTMGVPSPTNNPPALYEACEWTDLEGNFWVFGGKDLNEDMHSTLWKYEPATNMWTWVNGPITFNTPGVYGTQGIPSPNNSPGGRSFGAATWVDNLGDLWLFGGWGYDIAGTTYGLLSDMWKYDISSNMWTWMSGPNTGDQLGIYGTQGIETTSNHPHPRAETSATWVDDNENLWLFGGDCGYNVLNDLWKYKPSTNSWTWMKGDSIWDSPGNYGIQGQQSLTNEHPARGVYSRWKDLNGNLWLFGGRKFDTNNDYDYNDLWKYNIISNMWTWVRGSNTANTAGSYGMRCISSTSNDPPARFENRACWTDSCGNFWMFGGTRDLGDGIYNTYNDLWYYNVVNNQWTWVSGNTYSNGNIVWGTMGIPSVLNTHGPTYGSVPFKDNNGNLWVFGGANEDFNLTNSLWRFVPDPNCTGACTPIYLPQSGFISSDLSGCSPYIVNFSNLSINATNWLWDFGDGVTSIEENPSHIYMNSGQYSVTLIASNGTTGDTLIQVDYISVLDGSLISISQNGDTLYATTSPDYQWYFNDTLIPGATSQNYVLTESGYYYAITLSGGCIDTSNTIETSCLCVGINENEFAKGISIYPNPTNNKITVEMLSARGNYELYDANGKLLLNGSIKKTKFTIDLSNYSKGVYFVRIIDGEHQANKKIIKE